MLGYDPAGKKLKMGSIAISQDVGAKTRAPDRLTFNCWKKERKGKTSRESRGD